MPVMGKLIFVPSVDNCADKVRTGVLIKIYIRHLIHLALLSLTSADVIPRTPAD